MENKDVKKATTATQPTNTAAKKTIALTKDALAKMIEDGKGLRAMSSESGQSIHMVKKALAEFGLKTKAMTSSKKLSFGAMNSIYNAIEGGCKTVNDVVMATGLDRDSVVGAIKQLKKGGDIIDALAVSKPSVAASVATPQTREDVKPFVPVQ